MRKYFIKVDKAEKKYFKKNNYIKNHINLKMIKHGDLNSLNKDDLKFALNSDVYIIFWSKLYKKQMVNKFLIKKKAINIHMGLSPFYRGSSCNFWAFV